MIRPGFVFWLLVALLPAGPSLSRDLFVHHTRGADTNEGNEEAPFATIQAAVDRSQPGDRILLFPENAVYRQSISLAKAPPGLEIEGNGVTLTGADPLPANRWEQVSEDLYQIVLPRPAFDRHLLIVDGKVQRMGRLCHDPIDFPEIEELESGEFHWKDISETDGRLTFKGKPDRLEWSVRRNGLATSGNLRNIFVSHLSARHFLNDGFNIHGNAKGLRFSEISGYENFDEGFSAHDTASCWIQNSSFYGNENAVADVNAADTYYVDCEFHSSLAYEVLFLGGRHSLTRCTIRPGVNAIPLKIRSGEIKKEATTPIPASLVMRNVSLDLGVANARKWEVGAGSTVFIDQPSALQFGAIDLEQHPTAVLSDDPYRTFPIGRDPNGAPLMAWVAGASGGPRSNNYRIIHFDKHTPADLASKVAPENDWFGLLAPLPTASFPPEGDAFTKENGTAHAIWRWIGITAPDAVFLPRTPAGIALGNALLDEPPAGVGMVTVFLSEKGDGEADETRTTVLSKRREDIPPAEQVMRRRTSRSPSGVFAQLAPHYGTTFSGSYVDALAIIAKMRRDPDFDPTPLASPILNGPLPRNAGTLSGTLLFAEWGTEAAQARVVKVANMAFAEDGSPKEAMPTHNEMSDAIFMASPLLARAGEITGENRYFDQAVQQIRFIQEKCLREDGLYRHSPLNEAAWGRGNGFPVLGIAMTLDHFPKDHPERPFLVESLRSHLEALSQHQDQEGMWHQVIDHQDSYAEFTCTSMIAYGIARGIEQGGLNEEDWKPRLVMAWNALKARIGTDGRTLMNVCTSTGKQKTLEDYYLRKAILGPDARGGGLALLLAGEMEKVFR